MSDSEMKVPLTCCSPSPGLNSVLQDQLSSKFLFQNSELSYSSTSGFSAQVPFILLSNQTYSTEFKNLEATLSPGTAELLYLHEEEPACCESTGMTLKSEGG